MLVSIALTAIVVSCLSVALTMSVALRVKKTLDPLIEEGMFQPGAAPEAPPTVPTGTPLPAVGEMLDSEGRPVTLPTAQDGPWILTFQSVTCSGCEAQLPAYRQYLQQSGLPRERVISVISGARAELGPYAAALGDLATIVHDDEAKSLADRLGVRIWPTYLVVSPDGTVGHSTESVGSLPELALSTRLDEVVS
ncbi:TlpA family protein disulfide reductase [Streptomyces sp. NPDC005863]|uniref:TlpA family protein disulfide reductase n=1 Tax=unclassified Streptomyces TaxID=2593676 RepID=UPI0033EBD32D